LKYIEVEGLLAYKVLISPLLRNSSFYRAMLAQSAVMQQ